MQSEQGGTATEKIFPKAHDNFAQVDDFSFSILHLNSTREQPETEEEISPPCGYDGVK
jgi:hypothetical protein